MIKMEMRFLITSDVYCNLMGLKRDGSLSLITNDASLRHYQDILSNYTTIDNLRHYHIKSKERIKNSLFALII